MLYGPTALLSMLAILDRTMRLVTGFRTGRKRGPEPILGRHDLMNRHRKRPCDAFQLVGILNRVEPLLTQPAQQRGI
jgi:hypothetical protein